MIISNNLDGNATYSTQSSANPLNEDAMGRESVEDELTKQQYRTGSKVERSKELDKLKDSPDRERRELIEVLPDPPPKREQASERARMAMKMREIIRSVANPRSAHRATRIEMLLNYCVTAHRTFGGGDQEAFVSLVSWIEGATAGVAWKRISPEQWLTIADSFNAAYELADFGRSQFADAKQKMRGAGLSAIPAIVD